MTERALNASVFTGRLRGSLSVLLSALFILDCFTSSSPPFFQPLPRDVYYRSVYSRGGKGCMLNKIREWKRFRFAAVLSSLSLLHCFFFSILYKQLEALIFRKILLRRVFHPRSISSKEVNETTYWTVHIILFILVNIDIFFIERKEEIPV